MQFQIPQYVEVQDKIVGPLTLRQFLIFVGAAGISALLYAFLSFVFWIMFSLIIFAFAAAFAWGNIGGRPFGRVFISAIGFYWNPKTYVWMPNNVQVEKTTENMEQVAGGISLEKILSGMALHSAWQKAQTGTKVSAEEGIPESVRQKDVFQVFSKITGERRAAKRIDYR